MDGRVILPGLTDAMFQPYVGEENNRGMFNMEGEELLEHSRKAAGVGLGMCGLGGIQDRYCLRHLHMEDRLGRLASNCLADLIMLEKDPSPVTLMNCLPRNPRLQWWVENVFINHLRETYHGDRAQITS